MLKIYRVELLRQTTKQVKLIVKKTCYRSYNVDAVHKIWIGWVIVGYLCLTCETTPTTDLEVEPQA